MERIIYNDLDYTSTYILTEKVKKKFLAIILNEIQELISDEETYKQVRKIILDNVNELTRTWLRNTFTGDIEGLGIY